MDLEGDTNFTLQNQVGREGSKAWALSVVPHFSLSPFLAWGDFHAHSRFARSTIQEEK